MTYQIYIRINKAVDIHKWLLNPHSVDPTFVETDVSFSYIAGAEFVPATLSSEDFFILYHLFNDNEIKETKIDRELIAGEYKKRLGVDPKLVYDAMTHEMEDQSYIITSIIEDYYNVYKK